MTPKLPINLEDLLRQRTVEGDRIEYKAGWNPDPIIRTLCAFANDFENLGGGYVIIGQDCDAAGLPVFPPARGDESRSELPTQSPTQSDDPLVRLLFVLRDGEYSSGSLRQILGIKHRPTFRENYLHPALQQGLIEQTIPDKPQSSNQRYRLTDRGRQLLQQLGAE